MVVIGHRLYVDINFIFPELPYKSLGPYKTWPIVHYPPNTHVFDYKYDIPVVVSLTTHESNDQNEINTEQKKKLRG